MTSRRDRPPLQLPPISGSLKKKGLGWLYRPWAPRYFLYSPKSGILSYSFEGVYKGSVMIDRTVKVKAIPPNQSDGYPHAFEVACYKLRDTGEKIAGLKSLILVADDDECRDKWIEILNAKFESGMTIEPQVISPSIETSRRQISVDSSAMKRPARSVSHTNESQSPLPKRNLGDDLEDKNLATPPKTVGPLRKVTWKELLETLAKDCSAYDRIAVNIQLLIQRCESMAVYVDLGCGIANLVTNSMETLLSEILKREELKVEFLVHVERICVLLIEIGAFLQNFSSGCFLDFILLPVQRLAFLVDMIVCLWTRSMSTVCSSLTLELEMPLLSVSNQSQWSHRHLSALSLIDTVGGIFALIDLTGQRKTHAAQSIADIFSKVSLEDVLENLSRIEERGLLLSRVLERISNETAVGCIAQKSFQAFWQKSFGQKFSAKIQLILNLLLPELEEAASSEEEAAEMIANLSSIFLLFHPESSIVTTASLSIITRNIPTEVSLFDACRYLIDSTTSVDCQNFHKFIMPPQWKHHIYRTTGIPATSCLDPFAHQHPHERTARKSALVQEYGGGVEFELSDAILSKQGLLCIHGLIGCGKTRQLLKLGRKLAISRNVLWIDMSGVTESVVAEPLISPAVVNDIKAPEADEMNSEFDAISSAARRPNWSNSLIWKCLAGQLGIVAEVSRDIECGLRNYFETISEGDFLVFDHLQPNQACRELIDFLVSLEVASRSLVVVSISTSESNTIESVSSFLALDRLQSRLIALDQLTEDYAANLVASIYTSRDVAVAMTECSILGRCGNNNALGIQSLTYFPASLLRQTLGKISSEVEPKNTRMQVIQELEPFVPEDVKTLHLCLYPLWPRKGTTGVPFDMSLAWALSETSFEGNKKRFMESWQGLIDIGHIKGCIDGSLVCLYRNDLIVSLSTTSFNAEFQRNQWSKYYLFWAESLVLLNRRLETSSRQLALHQLDANDSHFTRLFDLISYSPPQTLETALPPELLENPLDIFSGVAELLAGNIQEVCFSRCSKEEHLFLCRRLLFILEEKQQRDGSTEILKSTALVFRSLATLQVVTALALVDCFDEAMRILEKLLHEVEVQRAKSGANSELEIVFGETLAARGHLRRVGSTGDLVDAEADLVEALQIHQKFLSRLDPRLLRCEQELAVVQSMTREYSQSRAALEAILEKRKEASEETYSVPLANLVQALGDLHFANQQFLIAEQCYRQVLKMRRSMFFSEKHSSIAAVLNSLGHLYYETERYSEARSMYESTATILADLLGRDSILFAPVVTSLGNVFYTQSLFEQAKPLYEEALGIYTRSLGGDHPEVATAINRLAKLFMAQEKFDVAKPLLERVHKIRLESLGEMDSLTITAKDDLSNCIEQIAKLKSRRMSKLRSFVFSSPSSDSKGSTVDSSGRTKSTDSHDASNPATPVKRRQSYLSFLSPKEATETIPTTQEKSGSQESVSPEKEATQMAAQIPRRNNSIFSFIRFGSSKDLKAIDGSSKDEEHREDADVERKPAPNGGNEETKEIDDPHHSSPISSLTSLQSIFPIAEVSERPSEIDRLEK